MKFEIKSRFDASVLFTADIADDTEPMFQVRAALQIAVDSGADLSGAYLSDACLRGACLRGAYLRSAYLSGADLSGADLSGADLSDACLRGACLRGAYLRSAYLSGADLSGAVGADFAIAQTRILPDGDLIGWKKLQGGTIAKLRIPADAKRTHAFGRKCRAQFVEVIEGEGVSSHDGTTKYAPGLRVEALNWCDDWQQECAGGIHFFITKLEAENY